MKLIMENWRKYLFEGMKAADDLPDGIVITIDTDPKYGDGEGGVLFYFAKAEAPSEFIGWDSGLQGEIRIEPVQLNDEYPCDDGFMVAYSDATKGWGPLLYDVAMEYATLMGNGLMSDRTEVSDEAYAVWDYYLKSRSDVIKSQTDSEEGELTPDNKQDDCLQNSTYDHLAKSNGDWVENPLSKLYTKEPTTIKTLGDRLVTIGFKLPS
jgi:hypothetical protein